MNWKFWFSLLFLVSMTFDICTGDDFDDRYCKEYIEIEESKYDNRSSSASDLTKRPLGFMSVVIPFVTNDARNPCFKISLDNKTMQTVQVLAKSAVGDSVICVRSQPPYAQATCQSGIQTCQDSAVGHDSIKYVFYCEGCETDIPIWFRITSSPSFTNGLDFEHWCSDYTSAYPDSLIRLPDFTSPSRTPTSKASHASVRPSVGGTSASTSIKGSSNTNQTTPTKDSGANFLAPSFILLAISFFHLF